MQSKDNLTQPMFTLKHQGLPQIYYKTLTHIDSKCFITSIALHVCIITCNVFMLRGRSQLSTFMKAYTAYARGEGVWDHRTLFP